MELPPEYLRGIEMFNEGQYFECHEALENLWLGANGTQREFLHGLIQIAAAMHHHNRGNHKGAASVFARARDKLLAIPPVVMRLDIRKFVLGLEQFFAAPSAAPPRINLND